jgi:hypothetical protein
MTALSNGDLVALALREPRRWRAADDAAFARLFGQARSAGLLARVVRRLADEALGSEADPSPQVLADAGPWPAAARGHAAAIWRLAQAQKREVRREAVHIAHALADLGGPVVVLKGASYVLADLPPSHRGRLFSDTDILVPQPLLDRAEALLALHGWEIAERSAYTQRYYREWSHELPPMTHRLRGTTLDVHHALVPPTARLKTSSAALFDGLVALPEGAAGGRLHRLAPELAVLHAATHLLLGEEMRHALRDLSDIDLLLRHFGGDAADDGHFWRALTDRAAALNLGRLLHYALHQVERLFATPVPAAARARAAGGRAPWPIDATMHWLLGHASRSPHPSAAGWTTPTALGLLYLRGHWLRMPLPLLLRHLGVKARGLDRPPRSDDATARDG